MGAGGGPVTPSLLKTQPEGKEGSAKNHTVISSWERVRNNPARHHQQHLFPATGHPKGFTTSMHSTAKLIFLYHRGGKKLWVRVSPTPPFYTLILPGFWHLHHCRVTSRAAHCLEMCLVMEWGGNFRKPPPNLQTTSPEHRRGNSLAEPQTSGLVSSASTQSWSPAGCLAPL